MRLLIVSQEALAMTSAADRAVLVDEFLDLTARLEGLTAPVPGSVLDPERLTRWQRLYGQQVSVVLANRTVLVTRPAVVSAGDLKQWIKQARSALTIT